MPDDADMPDASRPGGLAPLRPGGLSHLLDRGVWVAYRCYHSINSHIPSICSICQSWPAQAICAACTQAYQPPRLRCARCAVALPDVLAEPAGAPAALCTDCLRQPVQALDACVAAVSYEWPWRGLIEQFKFHRQPGWALPLARLMAATPAVVQAFRQADYVLPMPLHPSRLAERGYNQSALLARALRSCLLAEGLVSARQPRLLLHTLQRTRATAQQSHLGRAQRLRNLRHSMQVAARHAHHLAAGPRVLLLDDVMTTGASLLAAAQALRDAGCGHITGLVLARTELAS